MKVFIIYHMVTYEGGLKPQEAIFNNDLDQISLNFQIKYKLSVALDTWDLEGAYWAIRSLRRELWAKLKEEERKEVEKDLAIIDEKRLLFLQSEEEETKKDLFIELEKFYLSLSSLMKVHGLIYKEGLDPSKAGLRR